LSTKQKEQDKLQRDKEAKAQKQLKLEKKKIRDSVEFPFKMLFNVSALVGILAFFIRYFAQSQELINALTNGFIVFSTIYLGFGIILLIVILVMADNRKKEQLEKKRQLEEQRNHENEQRLADQERIDEEMKRYRNSQESANPDILDETANITG